jgi:hypothetical protein
MQLHPQRFCASLEYLEIIIIPVESFAWCWAKRMNVSSAPGWLRCRVRARGTATPLPSHLDLGL